MFKDVRLAVRALDIEGRWGELSVACRASLARFKPLSATPTLKYEVLVQSSPIIPESQVDWSSFDVPRTVCWSTANWLINVSGAGEQIQPPPKKALRCRRSAFSFFRSSGRRARVQGSSEATESKSSKPWFRPHQVVL